MLIQKLESCHLIFLCQMCVCERALSLSPKPRGLCDTLSPAIKATWAGRYSRGPTGSTVSEQMMTAHLAPRPPQSSLGLQPAHYWLRSKNSVRALPTIKSDVPCALAELCSKEYGLRSFVLECCMEQGSHVFGAGLTPTQDLAMRPRGQGKAHPLLFQAEFGTLTLPRGSCWT